MVKSAPEPDRFATGWEWLQAALVACGISPETASLAMGLSSATCRQIIVKHSWPHRKTLDRLAEYFGVDRSALEVLRPREKSPVRIAQGKQLAAWCAGQFSPEELRARARAALDVANSAPMEERQRRAAHAGRVAALKRTPSDYSASARKAASTRRARGWWSGAGARAQLQALRALRNGLERACLFPGCEDPAHIVYRSASRLARGYSHYHQRCFTALRRTVEDRNRASLASTLIVFERLLDLAGETQVDERVRRRAEAQRKHLEDPSRRGPRPTLVSDRDVAIHAAELCDELGLPYWEIAELAGWSQQRDSAGNKSTSRWAWEMVEEGRVWRRVRWRRRRPSSEPAST